MPQTEKGMKYTLRIPVVFNLFQTIIGAHQIRRIMTEEFIKPQKGQKILDIGCGTAEILKYLNGVEYVGFDLSPKYIEKAKSKYRNIGTFYCADISKFKKSEFEKFDTIISLGILHHLDDTKAKQLLKTAKELLKAGGKFISYDCVYTNNQSYLERFFINIDRGKHIRSEEEYHQLLKKEFPHAFIVLRKDLLRIPYTHIITTAIKMPEQVTYSNI